MSPETAILPAPAKRHLIVLSGITGSAVYEFTWSIAGVALPHMQGSFSATPDQIAWVMTAFIMGTVVTIACTGWLSARFGRKRVYMISIAGFGVSLLMCGMAATLHEEVFWRLAQGIFGAALLPLGQAITVDAFPPERHGTATAIWTLGLIGGGIMGPVIGGAVVDFLSWRWVFYLNIPIAILAFVLASAVLPETEPDRDNRLDWFGFVTIIVAVTAVQAVFSRGERLDWFASMEIVIECAIGVVAFYLFVVHTMTAERPFFRPSLFGDRNFNLGVVTAFFNGAIATLPLVILPLMLEQLIGYSAIDAGLLIFPRGIGLLIASVMLARFDRQLSAKHVTVASVVLLVASGLAMVGWTADVSAQEIAWVNLAQGAGSGAIFIALNTLTFSTLEPRLKTEGLAVYYTVMFVGVTVGIAGIIAVLTRMTQVAHAVVGAHVNPFSERFRLMTPPEAWDRADIAGLAALEQEVTRQAEMIAYSDSFLIATLMSLALLPLALMFRNLDPEATVD